MGKDIDPKFNVILDNLPEQTKDGRPTKTVIPASKNPKHEEEQAWLIDKADWLALKKVLPADDAKRLPPKELPIGGDKGWLTLAVRPACNAAFKSKPSPKVKTPDDGVNCHGLFSYNGIVCLWRNCTHDSHAPEGGGPSDGKTYNAFEAYRVLPDLVKKAGVT